MRGSNPRLGDLTTGVSPGGLGAFFFELIAQYEPKLLTLTARGVSNAQITTEIISATSPGLRTLLLQLDLGSQEQVRQAAREANAYEEPVNALCGNAGRMACPYSTTQDGLETQFGTMRIGQFLFTNLVRRKILDAGHRARVVTGQWSEQVATGTGSVRSGPVQWLELELRGV